MSTDAPPAELTEDDVIAAAVASGRSRTEIAASVGLSRRALYDRLRKPEVRAKVAEFRRAAVERATGLSAEAGAEAVQALRSLVQNRRAEPRDRIAAAKALLDAMAKLAVSADLEERLTGLEAQYAQM